MRGDYAQQTYIVQPHDTLYSIAWRHDLDYRELARWNGIGSDFRITVGQVLTLHPLAHAKTAPPPSSARLPPAAPSVVAPGAGAAGAGTVTPGAAAPGAPAPAAPAPPRAPVATGSSIRWVWPTAYLDPPRAVAGGGILLQGMLGQPVRAACGGRVVYVGSGIRGYGNLIIIKHDDNFLSAYAHTRELQIREGQEVLAGQVIAQMGIGPHQAPALYFEIRMNGKPVDPIPYLPATP